MVKTKMLIVRITEEQEKLLEVRARSAGFMQKSEYVRYTLFMSMPVEEKISEIYKEVCENG